MNTTHHSNTTSQPERSVIIIGGAEDKVRDRVILSRFVTLAGGRDANVVVWSGDPFEFLSVAEQVFVRGRTFTTKSRQQRLTERYMTLPPAYRRP